MISKRSGTQHRPDAKAGLPAPGDVDGKADSGRRGTRDKRRMISEAASDVMAERGIAGTTHRQVARRAGVPLAATTYHFDNLDRIVAAASDLVLDQFSASYDRTLARMREEGSSSERFSGLFTRLMQNTVGRHRTRAICWGEIMLNARRNAERLAVAQRWFTRTVATWEEIGATSRLAFPRDCAVFSIDILIGLSFMIIGLGLSQSSVDQIIENGRDLNLFRPDRVARARVNRTHDREGSSDS